MSCGAKHTLVVTAEGHLFAWGDNRYGQCGLPWPLCSSFSPDSSGGGGSGSGGSGGGGGGGEVGLNTMGGDNAKKKNTSFFSDNQAGTAPEAAGKENGAGGAMVVSQPTQARKRKWGRVLLGWTKRRLGRSRRDGTGTAAQK